MGVKGPVEVKQHIWLKDVNWKEISEMTMKSPLEFEVKL